MESETIEFLTETHPNYVSLYDGNIIFPGLQMLKKRQLCLIKNSLHQWNGLDIFVCSNENVLWLTEEEKWGFQFSSAVLFCCYEFEFHVAVILLRESEGSGWLLGNSADKHNTGSLRHRYKSHDVNVFILPPQFHFNTSLYFRPRLFAIWVFKVKSKRWSVLKFSAGTFSFCLRSCWKLILIQNWCLRPSCCFGTIKNRYQMLAHRASKWHL